MRGLLARMFAKATHAIALLDVPDSRRPWMLHALAEVGANAIQIEEPKFGARTNVFNVFARVWEHHHYVIFCVSRAIARAN